MQRNTFIEFEYIQILLIPWINLWTGISQGMAKPQIKLKINMLGFVDGGKLAKRKTLESKVREVTNSTQVMPSPGIYM